MSFLEFTMIMLIYLIIFKMIYEILKSKMIKENSWNYNLESMVLLICLIIELQFVIMLFIFSLIMLYMSIS